MEKEYNLFGTDSPDNNPTSERMDQRGRRRQSNRESAWETDADRLLAYQRLRGGQAEKNQLEWSQVVTYSSQGEHCFGSDWLTINLCWHCLDSGENSREKRQERIQNISIRGSDRRGLQAHAELNCSDNNKTATDNGAFGENRAVEKHVKVLTFLNVAYKISYIQRQILITTSIIILFSPLS